MIALPWNWLLGAGLLLTAGLWGREWRARREAQAALARQVSQVETLLETTSEGYLLCDPVSGLVQEVNQTLCRLLGRPRHQLLGERVTALVTEPHQERLQRRLARAGRGGQRTFDSAVRHHNGATTPVLVHLVTLPAAPLRVALFLTDVSRHVLLEEALRALRRELEAKVGERTRDLLQAQGELRALSHHLQSVREEEKTALAREIHDELGVVYTSLAMDLKWLDRRLGEASAEVRNRLQLMAEQVREAAKVARRIMTTLRPSILDERCLWEAMAWQAREFQRVSGIECVLMCGELPEELDDRLLTPLYRVFQESLTNVAKHAGASRVEAAIGVEDGVLTMTVLDNGNGMEGVDLLRNGSFGLRGMRERVLALGGELTITPGPSRGTRLEVKVALPAKEGGDAHSAGG